MSSAMTSFSWWNLSTAEFAARDLSNTIAVLPVGAIEQHGPHLPVSVDAAINLADTDRYWEVLGEVLAPQGHLGLIVEPAGALRIGDPYKAKCVGMHWEFMFARPRFRTDDMVRHHQILSRVGSLVEAGELQTTLTEVLGPINAANLREAHRRMESGSTIGKLALAGWD